MAVRKNRRHLIINIFAVAIVLLVTAFLAFYFIDTDQTVASSDSVIQIKIEKAATISVYAFGEGVEYIESTNNYDLYTAAAGTSVRLQAVNETRMFTGWVITKNANSEKTKVPSSSTNQIITFDVDAETADLDVSVTRVNATATDYGKYMLDRFVISEEADLIALQNILDGSNDDSDFAKFYDNLEGLNKDQARTDLQNGYFLIANNFTVFNSNFKGIGSEAYPFNGVMCGKNNGEISKLFITITDSEKSGTSSYGLFKYLGEKAIIRNLKVSTSIGIEKVDAVSENNTIYAGGLAGVMNKATLINVEVSTSIGIESNNASEIYAGGLFGSMESGSGIDSISDVVYNGNKSQWSIVSHKEDSVISAGFVSGKATDSYIKEVDIIVTSQIVEIKNDSVTDKYTESKLYLGNVFGSYYAANKDEVIDDIMIMGDKGETLKASTTNGTACVGGLIGYIEAENAKLNIDKVYFRAINSMNTIEASSIKTSDVADVYVGGIAGYIKGTKVYGLDGFKNRFQNVKVDEGTTVPVANYLFEGEYEIKAIQNGKSLRDMGNSPLGGKAVAGGLVGRGYIELSTKQILGRSELALVSPTSSLLVEAVQSKLTTTPVDIVAGNKKYINDKDHAVAALIYGVLGTSVEAGQINVYTNNTTIQTVRETGSTAMGDLHTGGFVGYASGSSFTDIILFFNSSKILAKSESYAITEGNPNEDTNNVYCGGFAGELLGNSSLTNIEFRGYNTLDLSQSKIKTGTNSYIESIQNTKPGGNNYMGENYIGGIVGRIQHTTLTNCNFIGGNTSNDYISMSGHQSPDSAFCGGIVGLIKTAVENVPSSVINCEVKNTLVSGNATNVINYDNPDIYIGGIIGAAYIHVNSGTVSSVTVDGCRLTNSKVKAIGNEIITTFAGGIIGGSTWQSSILITDCYVTDSSVKANNITKTQSMPQGKALETTAGGIIGGMKGAPTAPKYVTIAHSVVIDTSVEAIVNSNYTNIKAYAAGILGYFEGARDNAKNTTIKNCYSNALVVADHDANSGVAEIYGLAYSGKNGVSADTKEVNGVLTTYTYHDFTYNNGYQSYTDTIEGYSFILVDATGRYKIRRNSDNQYIAIWWNNISYTTEANATNFTFDNGNIINNGRYITFNNNGVIRYGSTQNADDVKTSLNSIARTATLESNNISNKYFQSYYLNKNAENALDTFGTSLGTGPYDVPQSTAENPIYVNPYASYDFINGFDGTRQKFYIELIDPAQDCPFSVTSVNANDVVTVSSTGTGQILAHIWINALAEGSDTIPDHHDKELAASNGWFILDYVLLTTGDLADIECDLSNITTSYVDGEKIDANYIENDVDNYIKEFTLKLYDNMAALSVDFDITHFGANYTLKITKVKVVDGNEVEVEISLSDFKRLYGDINLSLYSKHSHDGLDEYNLYYKPNEELETDETIKICFTGGTGLNTAKTTFKINLVANKFTLKDVTYADYTKPLNYYEDVNLGTESNPYLLAVDSTTKFIPIFTKLNDLVTTDYVLEKYIEECEYTITSNSSYFSVNPSGEVTTSKTLPAENESVGTLTITYTVGEVTQTKTIYIKIVNKIPTTYSVVGAEIDGLTIASEETDFYFEQTISKGYSSVPTKAIITINGTEYDLLNNYEACLEAGIIVAPIAEISLLSSNPFVENAAGYVVQVSNTLLSSASAIDVDIEYPNVYTIAFELQCEDFNGGYGEGLTKTYEVISGTTYRQFYEQYGNEINTWAENAKVYGYVFTGFYLVAEANSSSAYGISFDEISNADYPINSSNTFYGRWSYLIDILEAPGTHIKTGFNSSFMMTHTNGTQIPINNKLGYVFRVEKDSWFQGTPSVYAFIINSQNGSLNEVPIVPYPENENLYYVAPKYITGVLLVATTSTNSEVIVGENTSSVTEAVTPEDGIITFKYIANHYYKSDTEKSYIYNVNNYSTLTKEFVLDFYKVSDESDFKLPDLTEIKVYYHLYINDVLAESTVGTYITYHDDRIYLSQFKLLDLETAAFPSKTYGDILCDGSGNPYEKVTEVYYFTLTPPNGYSENVVNEMANYKVELGYVESKNSNNYIEGGITNGTPLTNCGINLTDDSKQQKEFQIVPTRNTDLVVDEGTYTFTDDLTYSVYDITLTNTEKLPDFSYISLYDEIDKDSTITSSIMSFSIKELKLTLGYRLGNVKVYGQKEKNGDWTWIETINVDSAVPQEYTVDFSEIVDETKTYPYYAYKIDNVSTNEIRLYNIDITSAINGIVYTGPMSSFVVTSTNTYALTKQIVGDARHDGKTFMLAIQLESTTDPNDIITDISGDVSIIVNTTEHKVYLSEYSGKNTAYINLSNILAILNVDSIDFTINITNNNYQIHSVQLLEVANEFKPSLGEVRREFTNVTFVEPESTDTKEGIIKIATYNNSGLVSGGGTGDLKNTIPINYFCDTSIQPVKLPEPKGNNLVYQCKILLQRQGDSDYYKVVVVDNTGGSADMNGVYTKHPYSYGDIVWTHAIATAYTKFDYVQLYSKYLNKYLYLPSNLTSSPKEDTLSEYNRCVTDLADGELSTFFTGIFVDELPASVEYGPTVPIAVYDNSGVITGGFDRNGDTKVNSSDDSEPININYFCDVSIIIPVVKNSLTFQNKILLEQQADTHYYKVLYVGTNGTNAYWKTESDAYPTCNDEEGNPIKWTHAIATAYLDYSYIDLYKNYVGWYIYIEDELTLNTANYQTVYDGYKDGTLNTFVNAVFVRDIVASEPPTNQPTSTIYYDLNGGEWISKPTGEDYGDLYVTSPATGETITLPTPRRTGYRFLGWYYVGEAVGTSIVAKDCLLVARWEKFDYYRVHPTKYKGDSDDTTFETISAAISAVPAESVIYVEASTYAETITINKKVTILGPNEGTPGQNSRVSEAIINGVTTITANGVTMDGLKHIKGIKVGGNDVKITNCYIDPDQGVSPSTNHSDRSGAIVDTKAISNLIISNCYIDCPGTVQTYYTKFMVFGSKITNLTVEGNYITNINHTSNTSHPGTGSTSTTSLYPGMSGMRIYNSAGIINIKNNTFKYSAGQHGYVISIGNDSNTCSKINIVENVIDKSGNSSSNMQYSAGIRIYNGTSSLTTTFRGNQIYNRSIYYAYSFYDDVASKAVIEYNYYGSGTRYSIQNSAKGGMTYSNNYYVSSQYNSTTSVETNPHLSYTGTLEQYKQAYEAYKKQAGLD